MEPQRGLRGFAVQARDGPIGRVRDISLDEDGAHLMVDTRPWWPGAMLPVAERCVERIDRRSRRLHLRLTRAEVKSAARAPHAVSEEVS